MPSQFFAEAGDGPAPGEKGLMRAVLQSALHDLWKYASTRDCRGQHLYAAAERWIQLDDDEAPCSFVNVCHALALEPSCIRKGIAMALAAHRTARACAAA